MRFTAFLSHKCPRSKVIPKKLDLDRGCVPWSRDQKPDDELNINPPTPCLGKRPQRPKPKGPGRPWGQKPLAHGRTVLRTVEGVWRWGDGDLHLPVVVFSTWRQMAGRLPREGRKNATKPAHAVPLASARQHLDVKPRPAIRRSARWRVRWSAESHWVHSPVRAGWPDTNRTEQG